MPELYHPPPSKEVCQLVDGQPGLAQDRPKRLRLDVGGVVGDGYAPRRVGSMPEQIVAAACSIDSKPGSLKGRDELARCDSRQAAVHTPWMATVRVSRIGLASGSAA